MVKTFAVLVLAIAFASPAFAQDDEYAPLELAFGYGNLGLPNDFESLDLGIETGGHSGFATHQIFNVNSWLGIENYLGYYGLGESFLGKTELITTMFGGKFSLRRFYRAVPYVSAGIGGGWLRFPDFGGGSDSAFSTRYGGGVDITINDAIAWKVDVSRMSFNFQGYRSGLNISTGIVLKISQ
jgi:opacity protein-like surface antigen